MLSHLSMTIGVEEDAAGSVERRVLTYECGRRSVTSVRTTRRGSGVVAGSSTPSSVLTPLHGRCTGKVAVTERCSLASQESIVLRSPCSSPIVSVDNQWSDARSGMEALTCPPPSPAPRPPPPPPSHVSVGMARAKDRVSALEGTVCVGVGMRSRGTCPVGSEQGVSPSHRMLDGSCSVSFTAAPAGVTDASSNALLVPTVYSRSGENRSYDARSGSVATATLHQGIGTSRMDQSLSPTKESVLYRQQRDAVSPLSEKWGMDKSHQKYALVANDRKTESSTALSNRVAAGFPEKGSSSESSRRAATRVGAERVLFGDGDDIDVASTMSRTSIGGIQKIPSTPLSRMAELDGMAHTPPRSHPTWSMLGPHTSGLTMQRGPADRQGEVGEGQVFPSCASFSSTSSSLTSNLTTPNTSSIAADDEEKNGQPLVEKLGMCALDIPPFEEACANGNDVMATAINSAPSSSTTTTASTMNKAVSTSNTPTPSPRRRELLCRLLASHSASALQTPLVPFGSTAAAAATALMSTPTPCHSKGGKVNSTPSWESFAQISSFPTPVKLSPIPTKGYTLAQGSRFAFEVAEEVTAVPETTWTSDFLDSAYPSLALSAITGEQDAKELGLPTNETAACARTAAVEDVGSVTVGVRASLTAEAFGPAHSSFSRRRQSCTLWGDAIADDFSGNDERGSQCSSKDVVSSLGVRVDQEVTSVWAPPSGERSLLPSSLTPNSHVGEPLSCLREPLQSPSAVLIPACTTSQCVFSPHRTSIATSPHEGTFPSHYGAVPATADVPWTSGEAPEDVTEMAAPAKPHSLYRSLRGASADGANWPTCSPSGTSRIPLHIHADTVNLGTPTVSIIQPSAPVLGDSYCSFLATTVDTQYIQALPIPGLLHQPFNVLPERREHPSEAFDRKCTYLNPPHGTFSYREAAASRTKGQRLGMLLSPTLEEDNTCLKGGTSSPVAAVTTHSSRPSAQASSALSSLAPANDGGGRVGGDGARAGASRCPNAAHHWSRDARHEVRPERLWCAPRTKMESPSSLPDFSLYPSLCLPSWHRHPAAMERSSTSGASWARHEQQPCGLSSSSFARDCSRSRFEGHTRHRLPLLSTSLSPTYYIDTWL